MEHSYASRMVPPKAFESYTPAEIALRRATLGNDAWTQQMDRFYQEREGRRMAPTRLEEIFRHYINQHFPIEIVDVDAFTRYAMAVEHRPRPMENKSAQQKLWWSSDPRGQVFEAYPMQDTSPKDDMLRRR